MDRHQREYTLSKGCVCSFGVLGQAPLAGQTRDEEACPLRHGGWLLGGWMFQRMHLLTGNVSRGQDMTYREKRHVDTQPRQRFADGRKAWPTDVSLGEKTRFLPRQWGLSLPICSINSHASPWGLVAMYGRVIVHLTK